jgi:hypothetical protein
MKIRNAGILMINNVTLFNGVFLFNLARRHIRLISKFFFISCVVLGMEGCESTLDIAGREHKVVTEKWIELSKYAESNIESFGVTITAQLAISIDNKFKLNNFKINTLSTKQDINLLAPNFDNKYICSPMCYQLIEYVNFSGESGVTLLTNYFDRHEFELFKFYGDIQLLNKQLVKLTQHDELLLKNYLTLLAYQGASFESAKEFIQFLTTALTKKSLEIFAENPDDLFSLMLKSYKVIYGVQGMGSNNEQNEWTTDISKEQNEWTTDISKEQNEWTSDINKEQNEWTSDINIEQNEWADITREQDEWTISTEILDIAMLSQSNLQPEALWLNESPIQKKSAEGNETNNNINPDADLYSWQAAKALPILVGNNVCSYKESYFGVVEAISFDKITVNILGQAKIINEGMIYPANEGELFTMNENVYFSPLTEKKFFKKSDVASCSLE